MLPAAELLPKDQVVTLDGPASMAIKTDFKSREPRHYHFSSSSCYLKTLFVYLFTVVDSGSVRLDADILFAR